MPSAPPPGDPAPADGVLPASALRGVTGRPLSFYVHVPFCRVRCGYCDFNTYTTDRLGPGGGPDAWLAAVHSEIDLAARVLGEQAARVSTVFFGGGTPTLLRPSQLTEVLAHIAGRFGLRPARRSPPRPTRRLSARPSWTHCWSGGINRLSLGMQSAVPHVLATLDRVHPGRALRELVGLARQAGFGQISLDLIYGTPGERPQDWQASLDAVIAADPDHVSAYALVIEPGTAMARRVAGEIPPTDDDRQADYYLMAENRLGAAGYENYEVSNWSA